MQARAALRMPWWTLQTGFAAVAQLAELQGGAAEVQQALQEQASARGGNLPGMGSSKTESQVRTFLTNQIHGHF